MFDIFPKFLSSIASFLFPLFASYKALKTSDPAQLTPWLMYWSVLSCALLVESWLEFILVWIPFYAYVRLLFLLYLVLPQTQGARHLYETYLHPYLAENENAIEDFIASAHDRLKAAGMAYLKQAIELLKTKVLGMPPSPVREEETRASAQPQSYTSALLARFSVPAARWATGGAGNTGQDFFNLLAGAVTAATGAGTGAGTSSSPVGTRDVDMSMSGTLVPDNIGSAQDKMSFIAQQKEKLAFVLSTLDKEARDIERTEEERRARQDLRPGSMSLDGGQGDVTSRPPSGHSMWSALSKSRSEVDFEKIDAESGEEEVDGNGMRRRPHPEGTGAGKGAWSFLGWGTVGPGTPTESGRGSGFEQ
ncbi:pathogenicity protein [Pseudomassariella vexata]|uniref:Protein YOP1 n=1 Tax=Pseudomassariella vexata TaxID=1141098 RepID=A0A1Y2DQ67_9PEZI|nr:pathogenicity protein [Pseudomassariella vexata]ORY61432.1 pathogenicity protein [Pseudomassariella vexata]